MEGETHEQLPKNKDNSQVEEVIFEEELDIEALDVIKRLYDKTFKDLVGR